MSQEVLNAIDQRSGFQSGNNVFETKSPHEVANQNEERVESSTSIERAALKDVEKLELEPPKGYRLLWVVVILLAGYVYWKV